MLQSYQAPEGVLTACLGSKAIDETDVAPLKALSILDRFLVVWILLAMAIGIILGNTVPSTGPALQKGKFVGVSIPIGEQCPRSLQTSRTDFRFSRRTLSHDVSDPVQGPLRNIAASLYPPSYVEANRVLSGHQLDRSTTLHGRARLGLPA